MITSPFEVSVGTARRAFPGAETRDVQSFGYSDELFEFQVRVPSGTGSLLVEDEMSEPGSAYSRERAQIFRKRTGLPWACSLTGPSETMGFFLP